MHGLLIQQNCHLANESNQGEAHTHTLTGQTTSSPQRHFLNTHGSGRTERCVQSNVHRRTDAVLLSNFRRYLRQPVGTHTSATELSAVFTALRLWWCADELLFDHVLLDFWRPCVGLGTWGARTCAAVSGRNKFLNGNALPGVLLLLPLSLSCRQCFQNWSLTSSDDVIDSLSIGPNYPQNIQQILRILRSGSTS